MISNVKKVLFTKTFCSGFHFENKRIKKKKFKNLKKSFFADINSIVPTIDYKLYILNM